MQKKEVKYETVEIEDPAEISKYEGQCGNGSRDERRFLS